MLEATAVVEHNIGNNVRGNAHLTAVQALRLGKCRCRGGMTEPNARSEAAALAQVASTEELGRD